MICTRRKRRRVSCCRQQAAHTGETTCCHIHMCLQPKNKRGTSGAWPPHPHPYPRVGCMFDTSHDLLRLFIINVRFLIQSLVCSNPPARPPLRFSLAVPFPHVQVSVEASLASKQRPENFYVTFKQSGLRQRPIDDDSSLGCSRSGTGMQA